jgi:hypothetical protein
MNEFTQNIPRKLPFQIPEEWGEQIWNWIKTRPAHQLDSCVDRSCRWTFSYTNHGIWGHYVVKDNTTGEQFTPEIDVDTL